MLADARTGRNGRHALVGLLRQSVFGRLAGYADVNDAERLCRDPAMRWVVGDRAVHEAAASASEMGRFETEWLTRPENLATLANLSGHWIDRVHRRRPPNEVRRLHASFGYQAQSWKKSRRVVAKVEWHKGELYPRAGLDPLRGSSVTNLTRPTERVVAFYNQRGTCQQRIKEGKGAIKWTRLSCRSCAANAVRLQLHALASNLGNFVRTLAVPETAELSSLTSLREKLIKIGARVVSHGRYVTVQMTEAAMPRESFGESLRLIDGLRPRPAPA